MKKIAVVSEYDETGLAQLIMYLFRQGLGQGVIVARLFETAEEVDFSGEVDCVIFVWQMALPSACKYKEAHPAAVVVIFGRDLEHLKVNKHMVPNLVIADGKDYSDPTDFLRRTVAELDAAVS